MKDRLDRDLDEIPRDSGDKAQVNISGGYRGRGGRVRTLPFHGQIVMDLLKNDQNHELL